ncbi:MAG: hypothetical protein L6Q99_16495 [Planctomycetes bacterium]|nr:hypothetical protein [Planctomycetota bacterium]
MKLHAQSRATNERRGLALVLVMLVLLAVFFLCAPFLMGARNATRSAATLSDRTQARLSLDAGSRHAAARLSPSHPATDPTPYFDDADELDVAAGFDPQTWDTRDPRGAMWDVEARDVAGSIDWNSAPPGVFANALGAVTRSSDELKADALELSVSSTAGFEPQGFFWLGRELIGYGELDPTTFKRLVRGLGATFDADGNAEPCGPQPASKHAPGELVIDQRAFAHPLWRIGSGEGTLRAFESSEQLAEAAQNSLAGKFSGAALALLARHGSTFAGVRAGREWQRAARLVGSVTGGETCELDVDDSRWFAPGSTVRIDDGRTIEFGLVEEVLGSGKVRLRQKLQQDYAAFSAEVRVLARRPVNVNTAPVEVLELLFENLQLVGVNDRITKSEARALAALVLESRPFLGEEDFLRRAVLPAAGLERLPKDAPVAPEALADGNAVISAYDAVALYANAHNANDAALAFSTMPLAYTTRDVYALEVRASVNAESGLERVALVRDEVDVLAPQRELMQLWARQEDFDTALRLDREAPYWMTGPRATSQWDSGTVPPSRFLPHIGTSNGQIYVPGVTKLAPGVDPSTVPTPEHVFASREDDGFAQLWPSRLQETPATQGRIVHFDHETHDPEGRYLPDAIFQDLSASNLVGWSDAATEFALPLSFSFWMKPKNLGDGLFLELGKTSIESDRVTLGIEGEDLVLRVYDGAGDHPDTPELDVGEARFAVAPGTDPGLLQDVWSHVSIDVRGTRPDQITMLVDGRDYGVRQPGSTRLTTALNQTTDTFSVESDEGFPDNCVVLVGTELLEVSKLGKNSFRVSRTETGPLAGFGGRLAREPFDLSLTAGEEPGVNAALAKNTTHAAGTTVTLCGYSLPLASNVPSASSQLSSSLGLFAVGQADVVVGGSSTPGDPVDVVWIDTTYTLGFGMESAGVSKVTGLVLTNADANMTPQQVMEAFSPNGGYALLLQKQLRVLDFPTSGSGQGGSVQQPRTSKGSLIGGAEIVRYSGYDLASGTLFIQQRNALPIGTTTLEPRAFVTDWTNLLVNSIDASLLLDWRLFVVPISIPVPGAGGAAGFLAPNGGSEFAQITHVDQAELTEWVRYDAIVGQDLVRNSPAAINALSLALIHDLNGDGDTRPKPPSGGGGPSQKSSPPGSSASNAAPGSGPGAGPGSGLGADALVFLEPEPASIAAAPQSSGGSDWLPYLGVAEDLDYPLTRAAREAFQFRGVLGTYPHKHSAGTLVLPVWRVDSSVYSPGRPGRLDAAFLMDADPTDPGWPVRIHHAHVPYQYTTHGWTTAGDPGVGVAAQGATAEAQSGFITQAIYVALQRAAPVPIAGGAIGQNTPGFETRLWARLVLHPSGERPREVQTVVVGGSSRGGLVPSATVDELAFGSTRFGEGTTQGNALFGANAVVTRAFGDGDLAFQLAPKTLRAARGFWADPTVTFLDQLPKDCGLLKLGSEILAYDQYDSVTGEIQVAPNGRGLLGTRPQPHEAGETAMFLAAWQVSQLSSNVGAADAALALEDTAEFPREGTVLVGDELLHYTRLEGPGLGMPRGSREPGKQDGKGGALFRGRFGTAPAAHQFGEPVVLYPFRYWDRWAERADAPELSYFGFVIEQPAAFWRSLFWRAENTTSSGVELGVLQRADAAVPWDADPENTPGLALHWKGLIEEKPVPIAEQSDRIEWRAFVRYSSGAYDPLSGLAHGWKQTPRLRVFGANFLAPNLVLRKVDR